VGGAPALRHSQPRPSAANPAPPLRRLIFQTQRSSGVGEGRLLSCVGSLTMRWQAQGAGCGFRLGARRGGGFTLRVDRPRPAVRTRKGTRGVHTRNCLTYTCPRGAIDRRAPQRYFLTDIRVRGRLRIDTLVAH